MLVDTTNCCKPSLLCDIPLVRGDCGGCIDIPLVRGDCGGCVGIPLSVEVIDCWSVGFEPYPSSER